LLYIDFSKDFGAADTSESIINKRDWVLIFFY